MSEVTNALWLTKQEAIPYQPYKESAYVIMMKEFLNNTRMKGVDVSEHWPELTHKNSATLRQGFLKARAEIGKLARKVDVMNTQGRVYLIKEPPK